MTTLLTILLMIALALLAMMVFAGQCWTAELNEKVKGLERKINEHKDKIQAQDSKADRLAKRIKVIEDHFEI